MPINRDLSQLTPGEKLWLWRHFAGITQAVAALTFGVHEDAYQAMERDRYKGKQVVLPPVPALTITMALKLARRREGLGSRGTAAVFSYGSHVALLKAEQRGDILLRLLWKGRGYLNFPYGD